MCSVYLLGSVYLRDYFVNTVYKHCIYRVYQQIPQIPLSKWSAAHGKIRPLHQKKLEAFMKPPTPLQSFKLVQGGPLGASDTQKKIAIFYT